MKVLVAFLALAAVQIAPGRAFAACMDNHAMVSVVDVQTTFAQRSVEIVTLAAKGDDAALGKLVSPTADFMLWEGDSGWAPRGGLHGRESLSGVAAARAFADYLSAATFEFMVSSPGPIGTDPCGNQSATVTFSNGARDRIYVVRFDYLDGRLLRAEGRLSSLTRGGIGKAR